MKTPIVKKPRKYKARKPKLTGGINFYGDDIELCIPHNDEKIAIIVAALGDILTNKEKLHSLISDYAMEHVDELKDVIADFQNEFPDSVVESPINVLDDNILSELNLNDIGIIISDIFND